MTRSSTAASVLAVALALTPWAASANKYTIVPFKTSGTVRTINDKGHLAGDGAQGHTPHGFVYRNGEFEKLPQFSVVTDMNEAGDVVGWLNGGRRAYSGYIWPRRGNSPIYITAKNTIEVWGLNDDRVAVGRYIATRRSFVWTQDGGFANLGVMHGGRRCDASAINLAGQITGGADTSSDSLLHAFVWKDGNFQDLGRLAGHDATVGTAINSGAEVVGYARKPAGQRSAFHWDGVTMKALDPDGDYAYTHPTAINNRGEIVGQARTTPEGQDAAVRFAGGKAIRLLTEVTNPGAWELWEARGINNEGVIIGSGNRGSFLLMPEE